MLDLDLLAAEAGATPKELKLGGHLFILPAELPGQVIAPFLRPDLGLVDVLADVIAGSEKDDEDASLSEMVLNALEKSPNLPNGLLLAASDALKALLDDQYDTFLSKKPSVPAYFRMIAGLLTEYGMSLSDFFGSPSSSGDEEKDSSETSPPTTTEAPTQTSEASSAAPTTPASTDSGVSAS